MEDHRVKQMVHSLPVSLTSFHKCFVPSSVFEILVLCLEVFHAFQTLFLASIMFLCIPYHFPPNINKKNTLPCLRTRERGTTLVLFLIKIALKQITAVTVSSYCFQMISSKVIFLFASHRTSTNRLFSLHPPIRNMSFSSLL